MSAEEPVFPREERDIPARSLLALPALAALAVTAALCVRLAQRAQWSVVRRGDAGRPTQFAPPPPFPELQADPRGSLAALRQEEAAALDGWSWADKRAGLARVPIEKAMDELAAEGLPHR